jgi:hypothetical protein
MGVAEATVAGLERIPRKCDCYMSWRSFMRRLLYELAKIHATFDDPNLVSQAGLVPVMALAQRAALAALVDDSMQERVYGRQKQGAAFGHTKIPGKACGRSASRPRMAWRLRLPGEPEVWA